jgi:hypothetical protein
MLRKIASTSTLLFTLCLAVAVFAQSVHGLPERVQVVRQAESSPSAALTVAAYHAPRSTASHSKVDEESNDYDYDVIIKNGRIIDGAGNPWVSGDLGIRGARIAKIGKLDEKPAQLSEGVKYVFVNGELEFEDGKLTQVKAGRVLRGSGWKRQNEISQQKD